jgi:hypothetical protein
MTEISSMPMDISLFGYYQMFTFDNIEPVLAYLILVCSDNQFVQW